MTRRTRTRLLGLALLAFAAPAAGHEEGVIHLDAQTAPVGGRIGIQGADLPEETALRLELRGTLDTYPLVEVRTDAAGEFRTRLALPAEAGVGRYTVVAVAPDGDEVAAADIVVVPSGAPGDASTPRREPTAEPMELPAARGGGEWLGIGLFVVACAAGGVLLLAGAAPGRKE